MLDDWEDAASVHAKAARVEPPPVVLAALAADFADMAPHLARRQPVAVRRDLTHAAARHAALIAGKWHDLGNRRQARRWWGKTRSLADESGDRLLASWLRRREAIHRSGDPADDRTEILALAREARGLAGTRPSAPLAAAMAEEAAVLAVMGRSADAVTELRAAEEVFERIPTVPTTFRSLGERELWFDRSLIYTLAGDVPNAERAQDAAERLYPADDQAAPRIRLHRAALNAPTDPVHATREAIRVLRDVPADRWLTRYATDARLVLRALPEPARTTDTYDSLVRAACR
jgi:hypothetical protein